jgi:hypothetical protein
MEGVMTTNNIDCQSDELRDEDLDQVSGGNIGSQGGSGTGAGRVSFNPFSGGGTPSLEYWLGQLMF